MLPVDANQTTLVLDATVFYHSGNKVRANAHFAGAGLPAKSTHWP